MGCGQGRRLRLQVEAPPDQSSQPGRFKRLLLQRDDRQITLLQQARTDHRISNRTDAASSVYRSVAVSRHEPARSL